MPYNNSLGGLALENQVNLIENLFPQCAGNCGKGASNAGLYMENRLKW